MLKFATAAILPGAHLGGQIPPRTAHRAEFQYTPREGYLYVRSRAISSRCNENWDEFPADEIKKAYASFTGKPVFVNHVNHNHLRARGVIIDAALHEDRSPDGSPDTWVEVLMEIDAHRFPKLAKAILAGEVDRTSMGCDVAYSICSACGNKATTPAEYCQHIPRSKGQHLYRHTASGQRVSELIRETCYGLAFFENSLLVEPPADPTAHFLGVDARGLSKAATLASATQGPTYYHGYGRNGARLLTGMDNWDNAGTFVSHDPGVAKWYGPKIDKIQMAPDTKVKKHVGLGNYPERLAQAKNEGYDVVEFHEPHDAIGHIILNHDKVVGREFHSHSDRPEFQNHSEASRKLAYGETKAPADVDTLREENCPVCGDGDTYDGEQCRICGFISPPSQFRDPDLDAAKRMDLRKQVVDPDLIDDNGELTEVGNGQDMPQDEEQPGGQPGQDEQDGQDPTDPMNPAGPGGFDPIMEVLDPSMIGPDGQPLDAATPGVSDLNGDGIIQPDEIRPDGTVSDPEQGGQTGPRELPYRAQDHTGDPFTQGPDMPDGPMEPEGPGAALMDEGLGGQPAPGTPGDGTPDLLCPSCGFGADATAPSSQNMGNPNAGSDGIVAGDVCPNCNRDQLLSPGELLGKDTAPPPVMPHFRR